MSDFGDGRAAAAGWYEDSQANVRRYWDGRSWTEYTEPLQPSALKASPGSRLPKRWMIGAVVGVIVAVAATAAGAAVLNRTDEDLRWAAFPHTASCSEDLDDSLPSDVPNAAATTVEEATLTHLGDQKLALTLDFAAVPPPTAVVASPYTGEPMIAPGSDTYNVILASDIGAVYTTLTTDGWGATRLDLGLAGLLDEPEVDYPREILTSADASGRSIRFEYDLDGQPELFGDGPFRPDVRVVAVTQGPSTPSEPTGEISTTYAGQLCSWNAPIQSSGPPGVSLTTPPDSDSGQSEPAPNTSSSCGPSEGQALAEALAQLSPEQNTGRDWSREAIASNFDACADLSTILVTVEGATGSSPVQALMFHRGEYLGTGTSDAYGFTDLDTEASTSDTVVLTYKAGQTCNACNDGITTSVRYRWDGQAVQMLDSPPS